MVRQFALNVTNAATNCRSKTNRKRAIQEVIAHKESNNSFVDIDNVTAHRNAITKISKQANVSSVVGDVKNSSRMEGLDNIRNPLSYAALLNVLFKRVDPSLLLSKDDVSTLLEAWDKKPKALTTPEANKISKELKLGNSTTYLHMIDVYQLKFLQRVNLVH